MSGPWTGTEVAAALGVAAPADGADVAYTAISTDTRTLGAGALFVALAGERHDGHAFLDRAAAAGARGAVVSRVPDGAPSALRYYLVPDTLEALGRLGRFRRRRRAVRVVAVTGSNGKTTTKELLRAVLGTRYRVHATPGNLNNLVGLPLTLLATPEDAELVVAELGTNAPGEIAKLASIAEPDAAVVTTIAAEHLEGLGDLDGVLREECSVLPWLPANVPVVVADTPPALAALARTLAADVRVAGLSQVADDALRGSDVALDAAGRVSFTWQGRRVALRLYGRHNAANAMLALGLGRAFAVEDAHAIEALGDVLPARLRGEVRRADRLTVVIDCYNANPASVRAAAELLAHLPRGGGRIAVLGSMLELGPAAAALHAETAAHVAALDLDRIVATGLFAAAFAPLAGRLGDRLVLEEDPIAAFERVAAGMDGTETVLLKASRGVALERLIPRIEDRWGVLHPHGETYGSRASSTGSGADLHAVSEEHPPTASAGARRTSASRPGGD
jgi:UDP-N-acetylmuramoyl-tripeptide--D-alanyl-D-alanine ligase